MFGLVYLGVGCYRIKYFFFGDNFVVYLLWCFRLFDDQLKQFELVLSIFFFIKNWKIEINCFLFYFFYVWYILGGLSKLL